MKIALAIIGAVTACACNASAPSIKESSVSMTQDSATRMVTISYELQDEPAFAIPYRALLPERTDNLLVAGRCMGCHPDMINLVRLIAPCMVSGQAAGTAAAMAVRSGTCPRDLDVSALRKRLQADGVYLG